MPSAHAAVSPRRRIGVFQLVRLVLPRGTLRILTAVCLVRVV